MLQSNSKIKSYVLETYGCQMNVADSELVDGILKDIGLKKTEDLNNADAIFVNTCAIRENAEKKIHSRLGNFYKLKQEKPHLIIGVLGCMAQNLKNVTFGMKVVEGVLIHLLVILIQELILKMEVVIIILIHMILLFLL